MRCDHVRRILARKAVRDLTPGEARVLADHLRVCPECAGMEDELDRTWRALERHPSVSVSDKFLPELRAKLRAEKTSSRHGWLRLPVWSWRWAALAVSIFLAVVILSRDGLLHREAGQTNQNAG